VDTTMQKPSPIAAVVTIVGGALLAICSFLVWATASVNADVLIQRLAEALGVEASLLQQQLPANQFPTETVTGIGSGVDGWVTLIAGAVAIVAAIVMIAKPDLRKGMGVLALLAGLVGGGLALYDVTRVNDIAGEAEDQAKSAAAAGLAAAGIDPNIFEDIFEVSTGIGLWGCLAGGVLVLVGGGLALASKSQGSATAPAAATGFAGAPPVAPATPSPQTEAPAAPATTSEPPTPPGSDAAPAASPSPADAAPPPPAPPADGTDAGGSGDGGSSSS
jgi:hypothetical protein